jgi:hypothetical protein
VVRLKVPDVASWILTADAMTYIDAGVFGIRPEMTEDGAPEPVTWATSRLINMAFTHGQQPGHRLL